MMKKAVSNVVGVLFLVAITAAISAIVGVMVFSFTNLKSAKFVAFSMSKSTEDENEFMIELMGGEIRAIDHCKALKDSEVIGNFTNILEKV